MRKVILSINKNHLLSTLFLLLFSNIALAGFDTKPVDKVFIRLKKFSTHINGRYWLDSNAAIRIKDLQKNNPIARKRPKTISINEDNDYLHNEKQSPWILLQSVNGHFYFESRITYENLTLLKLQIPFDLRAVSVEYRNEYLKPEVTGSAIVPDATSTRDSDYVCESVTYGFDGVGHAKNMIHYRAYEPTKKIIGRHWKSWNSNSSLTFGPTPGEMSRGGGGVWVNDLSDDKFCMGYGYDGEQNGISFANFEIKLQTN